MATAQSLMKHPIVKPGDHKLRLEPTHLAQLERGFPGCMRVKPVRRELRLR